MCYSYMLSLRPGSGHRQYRRMLRAHPSAGGEWMQYGQDTVCSMDTVYIFLYCIHVTLNSMFIFLNTSSYVEINIRQHNITCKIKERPSFHFSIFGSSHRYPNPSTEYHKAFQRSKVIRQSQTCWSTTLIAVRIVRSTHRPSIHLSTPPPPPQTDAFTVR